MIFQIADREIARIDEEKSPISFNSDYIAEFHFDDEWTGKADFNE